MPLGVIAILKVAEGRNVEFEQLAAELATKVIKNESKCNFYQFNKSREDGQTYIAMEQYVDQHAFDAHGKTDYFRSLSKAMGACMTAPPKIEFVDSI